MLKLRNTNDNIDDLELIWWDNKYFKHIKLLDIILYSKYFNMKISS